MQIEELLPNINLENRNVEFKRVLDEGKSPVNGRNIENNWLKTFVAFANTDGGTIYVGVDDTSHMIISLNHDDADKTINRVRRLVKEKIQPSISYSIDPVAVKTGEGTRYLLKISVSRSSVLPVALHENGLLGIYVRENSSSVLATSEEIRDFVYQSESIPYDRTFTEECFKKENYERLFSFYREKNGADLSEKALISCGFINADGMLSRGALLFSDKYNGSSTKIVCTLWPGTSKGDSVLLDSKETNLNIIDSIKEAIDFVSFNSIRGFIKEETGRKDFVSYPQRSVLEGIVNAVAHRNYYITGSQIEINMFRDRLEITSPGSLLGVRSLKREKNISSILPRRRNEVISKVLEYVRLMEDKGSGFDKIEEDYAGRGDAFMAFVSSDSSSFTLTLPNLTFQSGVLDDESLPVVHVNEVGGTGGKNDLTILSYCYMKARSAVEIASLLGIKPSTYFRKEVLARLVSSGFLNEDKTNGTAMYLSNHNRVFVD